MVKYWTINSYNTIELKKDFYDLGLIQKYELLITLPEEVLNNTVSHERIVQAILQHSSPEWKKSFPCQRERKLSRTAKDADAAYAKEKQLV